MTDLIIFAGTRPEVVKLAPLVKALRNSRIRCRFILTGQHPDIAHDILPSLNLEYDERLTGVGRQNTIGLMESKLLESMEYLLRKSSAKNVLALGDTSTVLVASRAAFLTEKNFIHIEAGLRTTNRLSPFPEEQNRRTISQYASMHFAPSKQAESNLLKEGYTQESIHVVGSTFIEAFKEVRQIGKSAEFFLSKNSQEQWDFLVHGMIRKNPSDRPSIPVKSILFTSHRRENIPAGVDAVCDLALEISRRPEPHFVIWPVHPNPEVDEIVRTKLKNKPRIKLTRSLKYHEMAWLLDRVDGVVTDSAGIMEEASVVGLPTVVARTETERPDLIKASKNLFLARPEITELMTAFDRAMQTQKKAVDLEEHLYGGKPASTQIVSILEKALLS